MKKHLLSILIPTYNRAALLDLSLNSLINSIKKFDVEIIVCDNASNDNTSYIVESYIKNFPCLRYYRQAENLGYDRNVMSCLNYSNADYIWILGDAYRIDSNELSTIINILEQRSYSAVVVNAKNRIKNIPSKIYEDPSMLLADLGWHMTLLNSCVFSCEFIKNNNIKRYFNTYFLHFGLIFEHLATLDDMKVLWYSENVIYDTEFDLTKGNIRNGGWFNTLFRTFSTNYFCIVISLPHQINLATKLKCIRDHDLNTHIFSIKKLLKLRVNGLLNYDDFKLNKEFIPFCTNVPVIIIELIFRIPMKLLLFFRMIIRKLNPLTK